MQVVMARSPHRCPLSYGGSSADVIQLPDMAVWRFSKSKGDIHISLPFIRIRVGELRKNLSLHHFSEFAKNPITAIAERHQRNAHIFRCFCLRFTFKINAMDDLVLRF